MATNIVMRFSSFFALTMYNLCWHWENKMSSC
jgi:hypothetical protein